MKIRLLHLSLLAALLGLGTACGKNLCKQLADDAEACGVAQEDEDIEQCEEQLSACSKSDERKIGKYFDCAEEEGLFSVCGDDTTTDTGTDDFDIEALLLCTAEVVDVSSECLDTFVGDLTTTDDSTY